MIKEYLRKVEDKGLGASRVWTSERMGGRHMIQAEEALKRGGEGEVGIQQSYLEHREYSGLERAGLVVEIGNVAI